MSDSPRHVWADTIKRIAAADTGTGKGETIRTCERCAMIMVTVHPPQGQGYPWHEFTMPGMTARIRLEQRPPCRACPTEVKSEQKPSETRV